MTPLTRFLCCCGGLWLLLSPAVQAQSTQAEARREQREARAEARQQEKAKAKAARSGGDLSKGNFDKEIPALRMAAGLLADVRDEKSARECAKAIRKEFNGLKVILVGTEAELENLAREQDKVNRQMARLKKEPWFIDSGLQECWTLIMDPFSRRSAARFSK